MLVLVFVRTTRLLDASLRKSATIRPFSASCVIHVGGMVSTAHVAMILSYGACAGYQAAPSPTITVGCRPVAARCSRAE